MQHQGIIWIGIGIVSSIIIGGWSGRAETEVNATVPAGASVGVPAPTTDDAARAAMNRGLDWLQSMQKENGSWGDENYPAMTAFGLWAFTRSNHPDKTNITAKAARFVAGFAQDHGGIYKSPTGGRGSGGLSTYNTAICMTALHLYDQAQYAPIVLKAREFMAHSQLQGDSSSAGGFGYDQTPPPPPNPSDRARMITEKAQREGRPVPTEAEMAAMTAMMNKKGGQSRADLSNTGWALMAMRYTQDIEDLRPSGSKRVDVDWAAAMKFITQLQNQNPDDTEHYGGFAYERHGERGGTFTDPKEGTVRLLGYGSMTYAGMESMIYAQLERDDPRVISSRQWAARHWSVDENPGMGTKGLFYYFNIMSKALSLMGSDVIPRDNGEPIAWKKELVSKLVSLQQDDGRWVNQDGQFWENNPVLVTSYVVITLQNCGVP